MNRVVDLPQPVEFNDGALIVTGKIPKRRKPKTQTTTIVAITLIPIKPTPTLSATLPSTTQPTTTVTKIKASLAITKSIETTIITTSATLPLATVTAPSFYPAKEPHRAYKKLEKSTN